MTAFLSDRDVAARVLGHIEGSTTDRGEEVWREPVANYRSPERLEREIGVLRGAAALRWTDGSDVRVILRYDFPVI